MAHIDKRRGNLLLGLWAALLLLLLPVTGRAAAPYFSDDMEGTTAKWTADAPWATTTAASSFHSGAKGWTDSPSGYYANNANVSLTMATAIDLSAATNPQLVFWHKYALESGFDFGYVEISKDGGSTWAQLASYTGIAAWKREQIAIPTTPIDYRTSDIKIRFRLVTDKSVTMDGWYIDDLSIAEPANPVPDLTVGAATVSSLNLSWTPNGVDDADFVSYQIYRSTTAGVATDDTLVTSITGTSAQATNSYADTNLTPGTTYYYKIYVVNTAGVYAESKEASGTTAVGSYNFPFIFDAENGPGAWIATAPWDITTGADHSGAQGHFWNSNPGTTYAKGVNKALAVKVNLVSAVRPILKFWQKYTLQQNADFGLVEVSIDNGANWSSIYSITGAGSTGVGVAQWEQAMIDLTPWAGSGIQLRFRITDNNDNTQLDGWSIDDVSILENPSGTTPYPLVTGFDPVGTDPLTQDSNFLSTWITTDKGWEFLWTTNEGHGANGSGVIGLKPQSNNHASVTGARTSHSLVLAKPMDLTGAVNPQFSFWHKFRTYDWAGGYYAYVSMDGGRTWLEKGHWNRQNTTDGTQAAWRREQIDLTPYANSKNVLIKFMYYFDDWWSAEYGDAYWYIDDLAFTDGPRDVTLAAPALTSGNTQHSATLTWAVPANSIFAQYELYRSTTAGITRFNTPVFAVLTDKATANYMDPTLETPGQTYYYRMYTKDTGGLWSPGSNEVAVTTDKFLTTVTFPFTDSMEAGGLNWSGVYPWAVTSDTDHTGQPGHFWSSNPGATYAKAVNKALTVQVNLVSAVRPILKFWQKYILQQNADFGLVEVSIDSGANWSSIYSLTGIGTAGSGSPQWEQAMIDLTPWAGSGIQLRFRITDNNDNTQLDGWSIDDVSIMENATGTTPYPLVTGFDPAASEPLDSDFVNTWITTDKGWEFLWTTNEGHGANGSGVIGLKPQSNNHASVTGARTSHSLVLAKPMDLTGAVNPQFSFWHKFRTYDWAGGYYAYVSMDGGRTWLEKGHWNRQNTTDGTQAAWRREQIDLTPYANSKNVLIKFMYYFDDWWSAEYGDAYWYIDDLAFTDGPRDVTLAAPALTSGNTQHSATLTWAVPANSIFAQYELYRSTTAGITRFNTPVFAVLTDKATANYMDPTLETPGQTYYYRMYTKDTGGLWSPGSNEVAVTTDKFLTTVTFPFTDSMEAGGLNWSGVYPWAVTSDTDHTGQPGHFWSSNPGTSYAKGVNKTLAIKVNLVYAVRPILEFWQKYAFQQNADFGFIEVSVDNGANWSGIYSVTGVGSTTGVGASEWEKARIDLTPWAGSNIQVRFRIFDNNDNTQLDGWSIDDVSIVENAPGTTPYPFITGLDTESNFTDNWITTNRGREFVWSTSDGHNNSGTIYLKPPQNIQGGTTGNRFSHTLVLGKPVDLTGSVNPQLTFWHKFRTYDWAGGYYVDISTDGGRNWINKGHWNRSNTSDGTVASWRWEQVDLSPYKNSQTVLARFVYYFDDWWSNEYGDAKWYIDDLRIGENETIPTYIAKVSGDNQVDMTGNTLAKPFTVKVIDSSSRATAGITVNFAVASGGGTLSSASGTSDPAGLVATTLTLGTVSGTNTVTATIDGTTQSVTFTATGYAAGQAMTIGKVSGDNQVGAVGTALANPLVVKVTDILGNAVADINVTFSKTSGGGNVTVTTAIKTDSAGLASDTFTLGPNTGLATIAATVAGLIGSPVSFTANAVLAGGTLGDTDGDGIPDAWETARGLNPLDPADAALDNDHDGLTNLQEFTLGLDPNKADTDGDGMPDGWEVQYGLNPLDPTDAAKDYNNNGKTNLQEYLAGTVPVLQRHFQVAGVTTESMYIYGLAAIDGTAVQAGDEIAAICPGNVVCGQYTVGIPGQYGFMNVYKDDPSTTAVEGAQPGDPLIFRVWDANAGVELDTTATVITGAAPPAWTSNGDSARINLNAGGKQIIPLHAGWNLISFAVKNCYYVGDAIPTEPMLAGINYIKVNSIGSVLASINGLYDVVRSFDSTGPHTFDPALPEFNDLTYLAAGYGYWIKMKTAGNLELTGLKAMPTDSLKLHTGWNLVGYWGTDVRYTDASPNVGFPPDATTFTKLFSLNDGFSVISGNYNVVRSFDQNGYHTFDPLLPGYFNTMKYLGPGYGMWIKMKTPDDLSY